MILLIKLVQATLCIIVTMQLLNIKTKLLAIPFYGLMLLEFCYFAENTILFFFIPTMVLWLKFLEKKDTEDALLISLFSLSLYYMSDLLKKTLLIWIYPPYNNYFETMAIQWILTFIIILNKKTYVSLHKKVSYHLCLGIVAIMIICISFSTLVMHSPQLRYMIIIGALCTVIISYLLIKYYSFFLDNLDLITLLEKQNNEKKYQNYNQAKVYSTYEKMTQLNHNLKYILLNIKYYMSKENYKDASNYIDHHLQILKHTNTIFTGNPFLDYTINLFDQSLKSMNLICNKTITVSENSSFLNPTSSKSIQEFMDHQIQYCQSLHPETMSLIIQEKGDFLNLKAVYYNIEKKIQTIPYTHSYESNILIIQHILTIEV